jgi:trehalose/maltose hydrolase-like predicted phosphorylase
VAPTSSYKIWTSSCERSEGDVVIEPSVFPVEPWIVRETRLDLGVLGQSESIFALSNGHIGLRGNLDEGEPYAIPGSYLNSFYELRPLPYAEAGYGYPESGQSIVNVTNGKLFRLLVDDEPFDVRYGTLHSHERTLDLRAGLLERRAEWSSPAGRRVRISSTRLVSFAHRSVAAICYEVEAIEDGTRVIVQSELVANEAQPSMSDDPRVAATLDSPLVAVEQDVAGHRSLLLHRTRRSGLLMAAGMDHEVDVPGRVEVSTEAREDWARTTVVCILRAGQRLCVVKYVAYGWSGRRSQPALRDQAAAALTGARYNGWEGLVRSQRAYLDEFWDAADVEVDGDPIVQQAVRFGLFHILQAGARAERRALPAKGLTGPGYDGHAFWDTEGFVLTTLTYTVPQAAADALRWRHSTLDLARERARTLGLAGATFPWRTIRGHECSAYWPAGTAAFHVNADIAYAVERYRLVTGDDTLERECGLELLVETARLWLSLGHHDASGAWHVDGVTGPDEYTSVVDDNVFTNLMAARNLRAAADASARHPQLARELGVTTEDMAAWRSAADQVHIPYDDELHVHPQSALFTRYDEWDFEGSRDAYPLLMHAPYFQLYRKQVVKQADLVLAMHWCGESFTAEQKACNVDYYERRTVRDSSLSACTQAVMCAEVGQLELAHDYLHEAALVDLRDLHHNTRDGLHMASMAGSWGALVEGFGGLRVQGEELTLDPQLPDGLTRLAFRLRWQGMRLSVEITGEQVRLDLRDGEQASMQLRLAGELVELVRDAPLARPWTRREPLLPRPAQPPGREPDGRGH